MPGTQQAINKCHFPLLPKSLQTTAVPTHPGCSGGSRHTHQQSRHQTGKGRDLGEGTVREALQKKGINNCELILVLKILTRKGNRSHNTKWLITKVANSPQPLSCPISSLWLSTSVFPRTSLRVPVADCAILGSTDSCPTRAEVDSAPGRRHCVSAPHGGQGTSSTLGDPTVVPSSSPAAATAGLLSASLFV